MENKNQNLILFTLQKIGYKINREDLFKKLKVVQEKTGINAFDIKQRTETHYYCKELNLELQKLVFMGLISLETRWNGEFFEQYYKITPYGEIILEQEKTNAEISLKISEKVKDSSIIKKEVI
jgi:hypothetical protein